MENPENIQRTSKNIYEHLKSSLTHFQCVHCTGIAPKQEKTHFQLYVPSENAHEKLVKTKLRSRCTISALGELCRDGLLHVCRVRALGVEVAHTQQEKLDFGKTYKERGQQKKNVFFRALPELPKPPPHDLNSGNLVLFFRKSKFKI